MNNKTTVATKDFKRLFLSQLHPMQELIRKIDSFIRQDTRMIFIGTHDTRKPGLNFTFFTYLDKLTEIV